MKDAKFEILCNQGIPDNEARAISPDEYALFPRN